MKLIYKIIIVVNKKIVNKLQKGKNMKNYIKKNILNFIILIVFAVLAIWFSQYHEPWADEAQSWLIARDLDFLDIIKQMRFEGHSFFWHFLLVIFAKNMPFEFSKIIMIAISGITGILILKKAPYRNIFKILILFNPVFLYYMPVLLRPYALIPLMLILISIMNERPEKYPVLYGIAIAILANAHIIMLGFAASIYFFFFKQQFLEKYKENSKKQNRRLIIGAIFALLGIVIVLSCAVLGYFFSTAPTHGTDIPEELCQRIVDFSRNLFLQIVGIEISKFVILLINLIILVIILIQALKIDKKQGIIFFIGLTFYLFVQIFLFGIFISQRTVLIFIFLLYFSWNTKKNCMKKNKIDVLEIIIFFICLLSIPNSVRLVSDEIKYPYSDSKNTAKYIEENNLKGKEIANYGHEIQNYGYDSEYNGDLLEWTNDMMKRFTGTKASYCFVEQEDPFVLNLCKTHKMQTIKPNISTSITPLSDVKKQLSNGSIISFNIQDSTNKELSSVIRYILQKGYKIDTLSNLLKEEK